MEWAQYLKKKFSLKELTDCKPNAAKNRATLQDLKDGDWCVRYKRKENIQNL